MPKNYPTSGQLHNLPHLKPIRKQLRNNLTPAEATLWRLLKSSQLEGRKFRRQHSISNYIVDFYCPAERLVIELDGKHHSDAVCRPNDEERDAHLRGLQIRVLRIENRFVFEQPERVLEEIKQKLG